MSERFPDVDWYCDDCNDHLNDQAHFTDANDTWTCADCGHENSISSGAIMSDEAVDKAVDFLRNFDPKKYRL